MRLRIDSLPTPISGDAALLRRAIANLIDNAILYTPAGTTIAVSVTIVDKQVLLRVADDGPGVPVAEHEAIFRRFVRLDGSRSTPGHGLGLNLVAAIAQAHYGRAQVVPSDRGLTIELILPLAALERDRPSLAGVRLAAPAV